MVDAIDELYTEQPYLRTRKMMHELRRINIYAGRKAIRSCYRLLNIAAICPKVNLTTPNKEQRHAADISESNLTQVNFDMIQHGLGCIDTWGAWPEEDHRVPYKNYEAQFLLTPIDLY